MRGFLAIAAVAALTLTLTGTPVSAAAADTAPPEVLSLELSPSTVSARGLETRFVTVTARLTDETGVLEYDSMFTGRWHG